MPLKGVKVVELAGLAPAPFCGMILSDFGASVLKVNKISSAIQHDRLDRGKRAIAVDIKHKEGQKIVANLVKEADVLIEPYRPGVMERLGLGPKVLIKDNPALIYARLTGFGQTGPLAKTPGHDINFLSLSGLLSMFGRKESKPTPPLNLMADFAGGGLTCALGVVLALFQRKSSGFGQVIDCSMVEGSSYLGTWVYASQDMSFIWGQPRGSNLLDSGSHCYNTYKTKDGKYLAVGPIEPNFYENLMNTVGMDIPQFGEEEEAQRTLEELFFQRTRDEWLEKFEDTETCVTPVLELDEAPLHPHNVSRGSFFKNEKGKFVPSPAPRLEKAVHRKNKKIPNYNENTREVLKELGYNGDAIEKLFSTDVVE